MKQTVYILPKHIASVLTVEHKVLYIGDEIALKYVSAWFQPFEVFEITLNYQHIGKPLIAYAREFTVLRSKNAIG